MLDPMIAGGTTGGDVLDDDFAYVAGLGLLRKVDGQWRVANPIYREVIPRALTALRQAQIDQKTAWYVGADGLLDVPKVMAAWQEFWREDGHLAAEGFAYKESGPHLMLMAFLQRIVNGGGRIDREYAAGTGRMDLRVAFGGAVLAVEVKTWRDTDRSGDPAVAGAAQLEGYCARVGADRAWLVVFDQRAKAGDFMERMRVEEARGPGGRALVLVRL